MSVSESSFLKLELSARTVNKCKYLIYSNMCLMVNWIGNRIGIISYKKAGRNNYCIPNRNIERIPDRSISNSLCIDRSIMCINQFEADLGTGRKIQEAEIYKSIHGYQQVILQNEQGD